MAINKQKQLTAREIEKLKKMMRAKQGGAKETAASIGIHRTYLYDVINGEQLGELTLSAIRTFLSQTSKEKAA